MPKKPTLATYSKSRPLTVKVKRKRWARGADDSALLMETGPDKGKQCCLGFACREIGLSRKAILANGSPCDLARGVVLPGLSKMRDGSLENTATCQSLMEVNDCLERTDEEREKDIAALGKRIGLRFVFEG